MPRYEGRIKVTGYIDVVVEQPGVTLREARSMVECSPESHKCLFVEDLQFEEWEETLTKTEDDEPEE